MLRSVPTGTRVLTEDEAGGQMLQARFSPDGLLLVTAQDDGARLRDVATEKTILTLGERRFVWNVDFSPDGKRIVTAEENGAARIYRCEVCGPIGDLLKIARERRGRRLSAAEKRLYLHAAP